MIQGNVKIVGGQPGTTYLYTTTDTAAALDSAKLTRGSGNAARKCNSVMITVLDNDISYAFVSTPVAGGLGHKAGDGDTIKLQSWGAASKFKVVSEAAGSHARLMITVGW